MVPAPLVSVVTPVYNGAEHLAECIESVLRQTYPNWEYVIVDNASSDGSADVAEHYSARDSRIRVIRAREFVDVHRSHNRALRASDARSRYCKVI
ncbi:MAG: glycosyltransferase, partial [Chloroflexi bacterium]|nr:glycosyltransferase [Chloroflexota bacterium]